MATEGQREEGDRGKRAEGRPDAASQSASSGRLPVRSGPPAAKSSPARWKRSWPFGQDRRPGGFVLRRILVSKDAEVLHQAN